MVRYIGKCGECKQTSARDYTETKSMNFGHGMYAYTANVSGRTRYGRFVRASQDIECPSCSAPRWNAKKVNGTVSNHVCDVRCTDAKGHNCECSCGGANHGKAHIASEALCV